MIKGTSTEYGKCRGHKRVKSSEENSGWGEGWFAAVKEANSAWASVGRWSWGERRGERLGSEKTRFQTSQS
jgi:hypothetical protein